MKTPSILDRTAAAWLAERRVNTVGIDALFIEGNKKLGKRLMAFLSKRG
ncbi:MAG: hypothetical protein H0W49_04385 [Nitrospirales bacterium]|nr:hypothetical protein [Nitrospirales bacterium]MBA3967062.1 hypothetical protein [Nitrospirales bacterium]